jgi:membrane glycosyltransferase
MERNELRTAAIGAVVTIALSFTGFSALLGGGVAGYLQREPPKRGARVGAISGGIAVLPVLLVLLFGVVLLLGQPSALGIPGGAELAFVLLVLFPLLFGWIIGLSAVGGFLGAYVRSETRSRVSPGGAPRRG